MTPEQLAPEEILELIKKITYVNSLPAKERDILVGSVVIELASKISNAEVRQEIARAVSMQVQELTKLKIQGLNELQVPVQLIVWPPGSTGNP